MASAIPSQKKVPLAAVLIGAVALVLLVAGAVYLNRPPAAVQTETVSSEARQYLSQLALRDVSMQATENFMKQQVIEVKGMITNNGPRALDSVDVYCVFYGVDGRELHREKVAIVRAKGSPLKSGETRAFRLPFDAVPEGWNQALPKMVIAQIKFAG